MKRTTRWGAGVGLVVMMGLGGCGDDKQPTPPSPTISQADAAQAPHRKTSIIGKPIQAAEDVRDAAEQRDKDLQKLMDPQQ